MDVARRTAALALVHQEQSGYSNLVLAGALEKHALPPRDKAFVTALFYGVTERLLTLDWCLERCLRIQELIGRQRTDSAWRTVEKAKEFIAAHYAECELSVEMLCEYLHLSPAYFSTLFKRETGMSFTAYVTVVRMERAAELLRTTEDKTYLIAEKTGYLDPNYFSYVFKKHFGISPTKFRAG